MIVPARGPTNFGTLAIGGMSNLDQPRLTVAGWDPIFEYDGETYAEMDKGKKNTLSHRAIALSKLKQWLSAQG